MTARNSTIDQIKAIACLLIIGHHLSFYGPMSDALRASFPLFLYWLDDYARMAVQVFLVFGGYFAAAALAPHGRATFTDFWPTLSKRFVRLSMPYSAALVAAIVINETVRGLGFEHASIADTPTWIGLLAHLLLLQSITGNEALFAGIWYVAIDFQLYALCLLWFWLCSKATRWVVWTQLGIVALTAASLWVWSLNAAGDNWCLYFMGAYGMGIMAWWATHSLQRQQCMLWIAVIAVLASSALMLHWRERIAVAALSAWLLAICSNLRWPAGWHDFQIAPLAWIGKRSYSIFLIHFPMCLLVNAEVSRSWPGNVAANSLGMGFAMLLSIAAGAVLYDCTENTKATWQHLRRWQAGVLSTGSLAMLLQWV